MQLALGYWFGCVISTIVICWSESHSWRKTAALTALSPVLIPVLLIGITVDSIARRKS
jgi:hypothetical protein